MFRYALIKIMSSQKKWDLSKHKCNKEILDGQIIHIDSVGKLMHAAVRG